MNAATSAEGAVATITMGIGGEIEEARAGEVATGEVATGEVATGEVGAEIFEGEVPEVAVIVVVVTGMSEVPAKMLRPTASR